MSEVKSYFIVLKYSYLELIKSKILVQMIIMGIAFVSVIYVATEFSYGVPHRMASDFGLGLISLSCVGISIFLGVTLISKEMENRTVYIVLSRPLSRTSFIFGKISGMALILLCNVLVIGSLALSYCHLLGGEVGKVMLLALLFTFIESILVLSVTILFSLLVNSVLAVIGSITLFIVGHVLTDTMNFIELRISHFPHLIVEAISYLLPNYSKINFRDYVYYDQLIPSSYIFNAFIYGITYIAFILILISIIFRNKNLD